MAHLGGSLWRRDTAINGMLIYELQQGNTNASNVTEALLSSFMFAESKSVRVSTVILASFNILFALTTALSILYDCIWAARRGNCGIKPMWEIALTKYNQDANMSTRRYLISAIHPAETFPLILSIGIVIQGIVFIAAQSTGLSDVFVNGCSVTSQFVFPGMTEWRMVWVCYWPRPAMLLVPYIQVVFGVECVARSVRKKAFPTRGKSDVAVCIVPVSYTHLTLPTIYSV